MKKTLCLALSLLMLLSLASALAETAGGTRLKSIKESGKLIVATSPDWPPYEFKDLEGNYVGADISLAQFIADKMGVELEILELDFAAVLAAVAAGKADLAIAGLTVVEERRESMEFSDFYYTEGEQVIVILKENAETLKTFADFTGKTVAAQNATLQQELVEKQLPNAKLELITDVKDAVMMVLAKKVDGLAIATVVANEFIDNYKELTVSGEHFNVEDQGNIIAAPKGETALIAAVNEIVKEVVDNGLFQTWHAEATELMKSMNQ